MSRRCLCGIYAGQPVLDLDYDEDSSAGTDGNFVITGKGKLVEVQASAEGAPFSTVSDLSAPLLELAEKGTAALVAAQKAALGHDAAVHRRPAGDCQPQQGQAGGVLRASGALGVSCVSAGDLGLPEPEETETTFVGNARIKAHAPPLWLPACRRWPMIQG
jgi:hypothetical protein